MPPVFQPFPGMPGIGAEKIARHRVVAADGFLEYLPGGAIIDGTKTRDVFNSDDITRLEAGLLMGRITASGKYANSCLGLSTGALTGTGTTLASSAAIATELVRRIGATGTFKLTGPPTAAGTVRTATVTYSAVNTTTGDVTITALGVNQQEDVRLNPASTGGNLQLNVAKPDGTRVTTANIAWNATDATYLAAINSALDTATGVVGGIVATAISATDTDLGFTLTYSGTGYAGLSWPEAEVAVLPTSSTSWFVAPRTTAVDGRFVTASMIQPTDGSESPRSFLPSGWELPLPADGTSDIPFPQPPIAGSVISANLLPYPADTSLREWIRTQLKSYGRFTFVENF